MAIWSRRSLDFSLERCYGPVHPSEHAGQGRAGQNRAGQSRPRTGWRDHVSRVAWKHLGKTDGQTDRMNLGTKHTDKDGCVSSSYF